MTLRPDSVVHSILYDENKQKAIGVKVIDNKTKDEINFYADIIFVNAGAIATNLLLLNSISSRFPNGLGNDSDTLGKYVAFYNYSARIYAEYEGFQEYRTDGRNPAGGAYIPRFRNLHKQEMDYLRGYAAGFGANRMRSSDQSSYGIDLKESLLEPKWGAWGVSSHMMGETIPKKENQVTLDKSQKDKWGVPLLNFDIDYDENDEKMKEDYIDVMTEMFTEAGFINIRPDTRWQAPGLDIHEMGGARMGHDPKTSILNKWNQIH